MAHGDVREGKWRGNWRIEWVASTLHTTSELGVSSITTADAHTSAASSRLNWRPRRFKWTRPFWRKTKSVFCACAITFQTQSTLPCGSHNSAIWNYFHFRHQLLIVGGLRHVLKSEWTRHTCDAFRVDVYLLPNKKDARLLLYNTKMK